MEWFNYIGLIFIVIIMLPNIIWAIKNKNYESRYNNKVINVFEQIGRYGSIIFMIFNIPYLTFGFYFDNAQIVYIAVNSILLAIYLLYWIVFWNKDSLPRAVLLSLTPSLMFVFSGMILANIPLIIFAVIFAIFHMWVSI